MDEKGNGEKGKDTGMVTVGMKNLIGISATECKRIFLTFDVVFDHQGALHTRSFTTWIPTTNIRPVILRPILPIQRG